jgi:hypothetical protein
MTTLTVSDIDLGKDSPAQRLRSTAAAVQVHFTWMGVRKTLSKQQRDEAANPFGADGEFVSAGKKLVNTKHRAWKALTAIKGQIIGYWKGTSLPYTEPGMRLIRQCDIESFVHKLEGYKEDLRAAVMELASHYDDIKHEARMKLGNLYNESDYPPITEQLFRVDWEFPSVEPPSYLMQINPELYYQEQQRIASRFEEAVKLAEEAFMTEFGAMVAHLADRLAPGPGGDKKRFSESNLTNLKDFFEKFNTLNVGSNQGLDNLVKTAQNLVSGIPADDLRKSAGLREQVQIGMEAIGRQLDVLMVDSPRRKIIRPKEEVA